MIGWDVPLVVACDWPMGSCSHHPPTQQPDYFTVRSWIAVAHTHNISHPTKLKRISASNPDYSHTSIHSLSPPFFAPPQLSPSPRRFRRISCFYWAAYAVRRSHYSDSLQCLNTGNANLIKYPRKFGYWRFRSSRNATLKVVLAKDISRIQVHSRSCGNSTPSWSVGRQTWTPSL